LRCVANGAPRRASLTSPSSERNLARLTHRSAAAFADSRLTFASPMEGYWKCSRCAKLPDEDINEATSMCSEAANGDSAQEASPRRSRSLLSTDQFPLPHEAWKIGSPDQPRPLPTEDDVAARRLRSRTPRFGNLLFLARSTRECTSSVPSGESERVATKCRSSFRTLMGKFSTSLRSDWPGSKSSIAKRTPTA